MAEKYLSTKDLYRIGKILKNEGFTEAYKNFKEQTDPKVDDDGEVIFWSHEGTYTFYFAVDELAKTFGLKAQDLDNAMVSNFKNYMVNDEDRFRSFTDVVKDLRTAENNSALTGDSILIEYHQLQENKLQEN